MSVKLLLTTLNVHHVASEALSVGRPQVKRQNLSKKRQRNNRRGRDTDYNRMDWKNWILFAITVWIIVIGCFAGKSEEKSPGSKLRDFSTLRNVLDASTVDSCDEATNHNLANQRRKRSIADEDLGEPDCLKKTDPIYYVSKYHRGVCHISVELAYEVFFGRQPSPEEFKMWYDKCVMREIDEAYMLWKFAESDEHMDFLEAKRKEAQENGKPQDSRSNSSSEMEIDAEIKAEIPVTVPLRLRVADEEYLDALNDTESDEFKGLADAYADALIELLQEMPGLLGVKILGFRKGSLIVFYELVFDEGVRKVPKIYDDNADQEIAYNPDDEIHPFDPDKFAEKIKMKIKDIIKEAIENKEEREGKLKNTILDEAHIDLDSIDTVPEDVINDLIKKNPEAPVVSVDLTTQNRNKTEEGAQSNSTSNYDSEHHNNNNSSENIGKLDEMEYSGNGNRGMNGADNKTDPEFGSTTDNPHNSKKLEGSGMQTSNPPHNGDLQNTDLTTIISLEEEGLIPVTERNPVYEDETQTTMDETTVSPYFEDTTTVPSLTSYPEIPAIGTLGDIENSVESVTIPYRTTTLSDSNDGSTTLNAEPEETTGIPTNLSNSTNNHVMTGLEDTTAMPYALTTTSYSTTPRVEVTSTQRITFDDKVTTLASVATQTQISNSSPFDSGVEEETTKSIETVETRPGKTTSSYGTTEEGTTTDPTYWDTEYLDTLDDGDYYDYSYENDVTNSHDDVTVSDSPVKGSTTALPTERPQQTTTAVVSTSGNHNLTIDDVTTRPNGIQRSNDSLTQISPTPERVQSTRNEEDSNTNKTSPSQTVMMKLRVTNMNYTHNLTDRQSEEFQLLEAKFRQLLRPLLQSLDGFLDMEVLGFSYGSLIVSNEIVFADIVPDNVKTEVKERIKAAAGYFKYAHLAVDTDYTEVLKSDEADLCEFVQCHLYANCVMKHDYRTECICLPGYISIDPSQCVSVCSLDPGYCRNGGECEMVPGQGAVCRCKVSFNWGFKGERCQEPLPRSVLLVSASTGVACVVFFILLAGFCYSLHRRKSNAKAQKRQKMADKDFMRAAQIMPTPKRRAAKDEFKRVNPVFVTEDETQIISSENDVKGLCSSGCRPVSLSSSDRSIGSVSTQSFYLRDHMGHNGPLPSDLNTPERQLLQLQIQNYPDHRGTWGRGANVRRHQLPHRAVGNVTEAHHDVNRGDVNF